MGCKWRPTYSSGLTSIISPRKKKTPAKKNINHISYIYLHPPFVPPQFNLNAYVNDTSLVEKRALAMPQKAVVTQHNKDACNITIRGGYLSYTNHQRRVEL